MFNRDHPLYHKTNRRIIEIQVTGNKDYGGCFVDKAIYIMKQQELVSKYNNRARITNTTLGN